MKKIIKIGQKELELECNLGTAAFFQELTGRNLFDLTAELSAKLADASREIEALRVQGEVDKTAILNSNSAIKNLAAAKADAIDMASKLTYIMQLQAKHGKEKKDIFEIREELNKDDLLIWMMDFEADSFDINTYKEVLGFWKSQTQTTSEAKN